MSIINQTLRELDARNAGSPRVAPPPLTAPRRGPGRWLALAALLSVGAGLGWALFPGKTQPQPPVPSVQRAVAPQSIAAAPAVAVATPTSSDVRPHAHMSAATSDLPASNPGERVAPPSSDKVAPRLSLTMKLSPVVERPPQINRAVNPPTAEDEAEERYRQALALVQKGRDTLARPLLEEAVRLSPGHLAARQTLATLLSEAGHNREAEAVLREGLSLAPEHAWFALSLARLLAARGDIEGAAATLQGGAGGRGVNAEYLATLAALYTRLKQHPEAARYYEQALRLQPDQGSWWLGLGLAMEAQGKSDNARSAYGRALAAGNLSDKLEGFVRAKLAE